MNRYLLDTNAFFEMLCHLAGTPIRPDGYDFEDIINGDCYISKITELEIVSVIGKYKRGIPEQYQQCNRKISKEGEVCKHSFYMAGRKRWSTKRCQALYKLIKEIINGISPVVNITVLDIDNNIVNRAALFMQAAAKFKFGSHDAMIASTAMENTGSDPMIVVTSDNSFCAAMKEQNVHYFRPGNK